MWLLRILQLVNTLWLTIGIANTRQCYYDQTNFLAILQGELCGSEACLMKTYDCQGRR